MDDASHADGAVRGAEVRIRSKLCKSVLINGACVGKGPSCTVGVIRGTKLPIGRARIAASNTVAAARPCPPHCIARRDIECVWHERETLSHRHVKNLARSRWRNVGDRLSVLIDNSDRATRLRRRSRTRVRTWARPWRHPRSGSGRERWRWRCCWCRARWHCCCCCRRWCRSSCRCWRWRSSRQLKSIDFVVSSNVDAPAGNNAGSAV